MPQAYRNLTLGLVCTGGADSEEMNGATDALMYHRAHHVHLGCKAPKEAHTLLKLARQVYPLPLAQEKEGPKVYATLRSFAAPLIPTNPQTPARRFSSSPTVPQ